MCIKLADGLDGEKIRKVLIEKYGIGVISLGNILRIAYSAVAAKDVEEMFEGIYNACNDCRWKLNINQQKVRNRLVTDFFYMICIETVIQINSRLW